MRYATGTPYGSLNSEKFKLTEHVILVHSKVSTVLQLFIKDLWAYTYGG